MDSEEITAARNKKRNHIEIVYRNLIESNIKFRWKINLLRLSFRTTNVNISGSQFWQLNGTCTSSLLMNEETTGQSSTQCLGELTTPEDVQQRTDDGMQQ